MQQWGTLKKWSNKKLQKINAIDFFSCQTQIRGTAGQGSIFTCKLSTLSRYIFYAFFALFPEINITSNEPFFQLEK